MARVSTVVSFSSADAGGPRLKVDFLFVPNACGRFPDTACQNKSPRRSGIHFFLYKVYCNFKDIAPP